MTPAMNFKIVNAEPKPFGRPSIGKWDDLIRAVGALPDGKAIEITLLENDRARLSQSVAAKRKSGRIDFGVRIETVDAKTGLRRIFRVVTMPEQRRSPESTAGEGPKR